MKRKILPTSPEDLKVWAPNLKSPVKFVKLQKPRTSIHWEHILNEYFSNEMFCECIFYWWVFVLEFYQRFTRLNGRRKNTHLFDGNGNLSNHLFCAFVLLGVLQKVTFTKMPKKSCKYESTNDLYSSLSICFYFLHRAKKTEVRTAPADSEVNLNAGLKHDNNKEYNSKSTWTCFIHQVNVVLKARRAFGHNECLRTSNMFFSLVCEICDMFSSF